MTTAGSGGGRLDLPSDLGLVSLVWRMEAAGPRVERVVLPNEQPATVTRPTTTAECPPIAALGTLLQRFLAGESVSFDLGLLALGDCSPFQRQVLLADSAVPRGWVTTYGRLAAQLGMPGAARAVGGALAHNPFPLIIPCHRAIRSDGQLGGFRGGLAMKRALLTYEGHTIDADGRVRAVHWLE